MKLDRRVWTVCERAADDNRPLRWVKQRAGKSFIKFTDGTALRCEVEDFHYWWQQARQLARQPKTGPLPEASEYVSEFEQNRDLVEAD